MRSRCESSASRDSDIDWLRGIFLISVLLLHGEIIAELGRDSAVGYFNMAMGPVLMPMFFMISGMVGWSGLLRPWSVFINTRVLRFLWPFLVWALIYAVFVVFVEEKFKPGPELIIKMLLRPSDFGPVYYLHFMTLFFIAARLLRRIHPLAVLAVVVASTLALSLVEGGAAPALTHASAFYGGLVISHLNEHNGIKWNAATGPMLVIVLVVAGLLPIFVQDTWRDSGLALPFVLFFCLTIFFGRRQLSKRFGSGFITDIGANSLPIYLVHWPMMLVLRRFESETGVLGSAATFWLALVLSLAVGLGFVALSKRFKWAGLLFEPPQALTKLSIGRKRLRQWKKPNGVVTDRPHGPAGP